MLASGLAVLATLLAAPGGTELEAGATVEMRVGQAPTGVAQTEDGKSVPAEQGQVMAAATPLVGLRWTGPDDELRAQSATRFLWRPVPLLHERPLVLETLDASQAVRSQRSRLHIALRATYGEEDYTSLVQQFANQPLLPQAPTLFSTSAIGEGSWLASRRTTLLLGLNGLYRRPLDQSATPTSGANQSSIPIMPNQGSLTLIPTVRYRLDRRSQLELLAAVADADIQNLQLLTTTSATSAHVNILTVQPQVGLVRDLNRTQQLRVFAGMTYAAVLINPDPNQNWLPLTPLGRAELGSLLWRTRESSVRSMLAMGTSWFADAALGIAVMRGTAEARLDAQLGPRWSASGRAAFTTDLNRPVLPKTTVVFYDETILQLDVPLRYRWSTQTMIEFGGRWAERGPNVRAGDFTWRNRELWAFVMMTGTTHQAPRSPTASLRP